MTTSDRAKRVYPMPPDEAERLAELYRLDLLDGEPDAQIDRICDLARTLFNVPIAYVSLVDRDRQTFLARRGIDLCAVDRADSFCSITILGREPVVVPDAWIDTRFNGGVLMHGETQARFYAGVPLRVSGQAIGALCIVDSVPRELSTDDAVHLRALADVVASEIVSQHAARELRANRKHLAQIIRMAGIGGVEFTGASGTWSGDAEFCRIFGLTGQSVDQGTGGNGADIPQPLIDALFSSGLPCDTEVRGTRPDGETFWVRVLAEYETTNGTIDRVIGAVQDIGDRKRAEARLREVAFRDALTGLPNRASFIDTLNSCIGTAAADFSRVVVIKFNIDYFRDVNDAFGYQVGDALLKSVAKALSNDFGAAGTVTHIGGDEFAVIMHGAAVDQAERITGKFVERAKTLFRHEHVTLPLVISAGIAIFPDHAGDTDAMMRNAKVALFQAKARQRGSVLVYDPGIAKAAEDKAALLRNIRRGIDNHEFIMHYQPIVGLREKKVAGLEALMRWNHPERGVLAPAHFMIAFDDPALAIKLGDLALDTAIAQMRQWLDAGVAFGNVAVNLSTAQFRLTDLAAIILGKLDRAGVSPQRLTLEVTEGVYMDWGADVVAATVRTLHDAGVSIALDDFGTGYASLSHLQRFPIDKLKIDKSFVQSLESTSIVDAVINLGISLGMQVVAEGVEKPEQLALLRLKGCDFVQGYIYSKPIAPAQIAAFIEDFAATGTAMKEVV
ncbi:MAG: EAL domain-containing protein [Pseudolabrys sp.]|nr:EAL domain-containing protein [Pseudolabrys sp.]